ncbi:Methyltransferase domain-containing protein [Pseudarcicella hirudinis]|uniref:Methyltransferase domain-containing protein n=1 Tax=Pseudarcicella hirudinis TaxID=1079859 RepID=A0A1I5TRY2_9BACT|nr:class I SAM-dependent methyltransferase [Pseudarcicella hirudinis]SFP85832.1 Methyltransferase domain-containing protein [Pseudarcicella hirudinis]
MKKSQLVHNEIDVFYTQTSEEERLQLGLGPLEFERNKDLIGRFIPNPQAVIVDVGGGPGIYSEWLAGLGHKVHLVDPVEKHIKQAQKRAAKRKSTFSCYLGEARKLEFKDDFADLVILHGPLYHLQAREDRIKAIAEAHRVLKKGGIMLGFAINSAATTVAGLLNGIIHEPGFLEMCKTELSTGVHNPPPNWPGLLVQGFYHKPAELLNEVEETGLKYIDTFAVEGMIWLDRNYYENRHNPERKQGMMDLLQLTEKEKSLLSFSPHMMIAAQKA